MDYVGFCRVGYSSRLDIWTSGNIGYILGIVQVERLKYLIKSYI